MALNLSNGAIKTLIFTFCVCFAQAFMESPDDLLIFCKEHVNIERCAHQHLDTSVSIYDVFDIMVNNVSRIPDMCESNRVMSCMGPCLLEFRASRYSYLWHICAFNRWIEWEDHCWTSTWAQEATVCYDMLYPQNSLDSNPLIQLYPIPARAYDRHTIERDCFPSAITAGDKCPYYQSWLFQQLTPHHYQLFGYPDNFNHIEDVIGFPGIDN